MDSLFLRHLTLIIVAAAGCMLLARQLRLPSIVACLLAGLLLGPATGWVTITESLDQLAEVGIVLMLFLVGLELSFDKLRGLAAPVLSAGLAQMGLIAGAGFGLARGLGFPPGEALLLAGALTFSSTVVAVKLLEQRHELNRLHGRIAVGILLLQDLVVILLLTLMAAFSGEDGAASGSVAGNVLRALVTMVLLGAAVLGTARWALRRPFAWIVRSPSAFLVWSLCWCFVVVEAAHLLHLSPESGAFLAGVSLAQLPYTHDLRHRIHPLMNFFIAIFFVSLGIRIPLGEAAAQWPTALALTALVMAGKGLAILLPLRALKYSGRTAFFSGLALTQISEFSFILAAIASEAGWIGPAALSVIGLVGLITFTASACALLYQERLYWWVLKLPVGRRLARGGRDPSEPATPAWRDHIILVGMNTLGRDLARRLHARGERVLAVDTDPAKLAGLPTATHLGNVEYASVLEEAGLAGARLLVSALRIEPTNDLLAFRCREAGIPCAILVVDLSVVDNLLEADVKYLMIPKVDGIKLQQQELRQRGFLPA